MTLKFDRWPRKIIGHLFYITSSFLLHLKPLSEFKLGLLSGNAQFGSKSAIYCQVWPWNLMMTLKNNRAPFYVASGFVYHFIAIGDLKLELQSGNAQFGSKSAFFCSVWPWNYIDDLENNRAPILFCFKLYASFYSHQWTKVTVRKRSIRVKISDSLSSVTLRSDGWPRKTIGHLFNATSSFVHYCVAIGEFKLVLQYRNA